MMDIPGLLPNSDNLYKFLFLAGITISVFAIVYPREKVSQIELLIKEAEKNQEMLVQEHKWIEAIQQLDTIQNIDNQTRDSIISRIERNQLLIKKRIESKFELLKIGLLIKQSKQHLNEFFVIGILGSFCMIYGFTNWYRLTKKAEAMHNSDSKTKTSSEDK